MVIVKVYSIALFRSHLLRMSRSFWLKADMIHSNKSVLNYKAAIIKGQPTSEIHKVNLEKKEKRDKKCINSPGRSVIDSDSLLLCLT